MQMLSPDLLDRRALALIELTDYAGKPVAAPAELSGNGMRFFAKGGGRYALLEAAGFESYTASFASAPALAAKTLPFAIRIANPVHMSRLAEIRLPRTADPADRGKPESLFQPLRIMIHPATAAPIPATAAAVRVTVVHKTNKKLVGGALVRVKSANGKFAATGLTDVTGEALVIVPAFPISFTTGGATVEDSLAATVTAVADPANVLLTDPADLATILQAGSLPSPIDPDKLASQFAAPPGGTAIRLSTRRVESVKIEWNPP